MRYPVFVFYAFYVFVAGICVERAARKWAHPFCECGIHGVLSALSDLYSLHRVALSVVIGVTYYRTWNGARGCILCWLRVVSCLFFTHPLCVFSLFQTVSIIKSYLLPYLQPDLHDYCHLRCIDWSVNSPSYMNELVSFKNGFNNRLILDYVRI